MEKLIINLFIVTSHMYSRYYELLFKKFLVLFLNVVIPIMIIIHVLIGHNTFLHKNLYFYIYSTTQKL